MVVGKLWSVENQNDFFSDLDFSSIRYEEFVIILDHSSIYIQFHLCLMGVITCIFPPPFMIFV